MSDAAGTKNDGGVVFGSQILSINDRDDSAQDYIAEQFSLEDGSNWFVRKNEVGVPNGQVGVDEVPTGSATLQLADDSVKLPKKYAVFTAVEVGGSTVSLIVAKVGEAFTQDGETKVTIDIRAEIGS
jgi:hypothetical protein